jgi:dTDP-4-amino-4,6-dideoxygalactose transaminase
VEEKFVLTKPYVSNESRQYVIDALNKNHQHGDGEYGSRTISVLKQLIDQRNVLLTPSCTSSLEMASILMELEPGDEVVMPSFNFTSAAIAVTLFGGVPVFVDIDPETMCIDTKKIEGAISKKTKAISWVDYAGFTPDLQKLRELGDENDLYLIEDNAHGLGAAYQGSLLGLTGDFVTYSFHSSKNFQCGEGGAISIRNERDFMRANLVRDKGTNRIEFNQGKTDKYTWVDKGSSYTLSEIQAALLFGNLQNFNDIQESRLSLYNQYCKNFLELSQVFNVRGNFLKQDSKFAAHLFYFKVENVDTRNEMISHLRKKSVIAAFHYQALHSSSAGIKYGKKSGSFTHTDDASMCLIRLPLYYGMTLNTVDKISELVADFFRICK